MRLFSNKKKRIKHQQALLLKQKSLQLSIMYQHLALTSEAHGTATNTDEIIISLTSFSHRVNDLYLTIESLFQQSLKADRIILWLSLKDFPNKVFDLPEQLKKQMKRGLEVAFCEQDLGPYTKFYYTLKENPNSLIITVDDDILYPVDLVDQLYRAYKKEPHIIHCQRAHQMALSHATELMPYKQWKKDITESMADRTVFPTGVGGVLYFPGCFADEILDKDTFLKLAPNSDDVWLKAMSLKKGVLSKKIADSRPWFSRYLVIEGSQLFALKRKNKSPGQGNDPKLKAVFDHYQLWDQLK